ncbi:dol-P-Man:Man(5)GlcNAc(2)-PP-Dol alpha-1,3-mannosyltransferase isoform X1 [Populus trichocarpa]|uniref:dol-P-Man:Man(5)GlcNAc(2)-PP-Dol alpha-1,3-mannosyltransferase isoform X1 n=1 Tax=Populus trichocarpa TaxID=3694 RepID=UPI0022779DA3|nr:dol-P-Man:Man(5)GlcNAc(2)-PP-Dol alpha-1,3-mannosyltransferase isoform X1 [Populus trichocarpa]
MALKPGRKLQPSRSRRPQIFKNPKAAFALALIFMDALLVALIIAYVPYTKIDWDAYMSQVTGFLGGERDYTNLKGDTGPLVYPAGFLYIYSAIRFITGGEVYPAQILFGILYIINLSIVIFIYVKTEVLPWWALILLSLSKRVHSIFVLRLFNDCFAMTLLHAALATILYQKWHLGLILFSGAVSIKMNVLLYAPPLLLLMLKAMNIYGVISALACAALVQILAGLPFLVSHPIAYISRAFNLGRVFIHFWSVNFKFIPEPVFVSKQFAISLLIAHLGLLATFAHYKWCRHEGRLFKFLHSKVTSALSSSSSSGLKILKEEHIMTTLFAGNFIGIVCARSLHYQFYSWYVLLLHYQFYSWYFYSLPYLLWKTHFPTSLRLILFVGVEFCWNVYPSNNYSSALLLCLHLLILWGLWSAQSEYPYVEEKLSTRKKEK